MLGLSSGLVWDASANAYPPIVNPLDIYYMMLWWDFTDTTTLFQEIDSFTTAADANNDPIGRVKNKALTAQQQYPWLDDEDRLGLFGRAVADGNRPAFKTGGANNYGYAQFTGSGSDYLECKQAAGYGVHSGTSLSDAKVASNKWTLVVVAQADAAGDSSTTEEICSIQMTDDSDTDKGVKLQVDRRDDGGSDDGDVQLTAISTNNDYSSSSITNTLMPGPPNTWNTHMNDKLEVRIFSANYSFASLTVAQRGLNQIGGLPGGYDALTAAEGAARIYSFDESNNDAHFRVGIGHLPSNNRYFDGKIYEVIFYRGGIPVSVANGLAWYYADKYGIDIEGAN